MTYASEANAKFVRQMRQRRGWCLGSWSVAVDVVGGLAQCEQCGKSLTVTRSGSEAVPGPPVLHAHRGQRVHGKWVEPSAKPEVDPRVTADVLAMIRALENDKLYGPYIFMIGEGAAQAQGIKAGVYRFNGQGGSYDYFTFAEWESQQ